MSTRNLKSGENAPLPSGTARLTVSPPSVPLLIVQLSAADTLIGAPTADGHSGVLAIDGADLPVTLTALDPAVQRCLLVAHGRPIGTPVVELATDTDHLRFTPGPTSGPALVLIEFYRRDDAWKVRALGHSYAGGLVELGRQHGADLTALASSSSPSAAAPLPAGTASVPDPGQSWVPGPPDADGFSSVPNPQPPPSPHEGTERVSRQLMGIWEDAARSNIAFAEAVSFAEDRRDRELEQLVADVAGRDPNHPGRRTAEQRCQQVVDTASQRRLDDIDQLVAELRQVESALPASAARWNSPAWHQPIPDSGTSVIRIGEITREDSQALRVPMMQGILIQGGLCLETTGSTLPPAAIGVLHRIFAAAPAGRSVEVLSDDGQLAAALGLSSPVLDSAARAERIAAIALAVDLREMAGGDHGYTVNADELPGVLVVPSPSLGLSEAEIKDLAKITVTGPRFGLSTVFTGVRSEIEALGLAVPPLFAPVVPAQTQDPWTGQVWDFRPDEGDVDSALGRQLRQRMGLPG